MTQEKNLIKLIIARASGVRGDGIEELLGSPTINFKRFKALIIYHDLMALSYIALKDHFSLLPKNLSEFLRKLSENILIQCTYFWYEFLHISEAFRKAGVSILPIKGIALLGDIYKDKFFRPMIDMDLLVKEAEFEKAEEILYNLGYTKDLEGLKEEYWRKKQCHIVFYKTTTERPMRVELHWGIDFKRQGRSILPELWDNVREVKIDNYTVKLLSPEDTLFSLALHPRRLGKTLSLKNIYDMILLLDTYAVTFDWDYCLKSAKRYNLCSVLFFALSQTRLVSDIDIPEYVWGELHIPRWKKQLIRRFIEKNTFSINRTKDYKGLYFKAHFLLYDSLWEPIDYIIKIPREQFAKFYNLKPYGRKTGLLYRNRLLYMPFKAICSLALGKG